MMRKPVRAVVTVLASVGLVVTAGVVPSQAAPLDISRGAYTCTANVYKPSLSASAQAAACVEVQVYISYSNYGDVVTNYGAMAGYSSASAGNSSIIARGVRAQVGSAYSTWRTY